MLAFSHVQTISVVWMYESFVLYKLDALKTYLFPFFFHLSSSDDALSLSDAPVVACIDVSGPSHVRQCYMSSVANLAADLNLNFSARPTVTAAYLPLGRLIVGNQHWTEIEADGCCKENELLVAEYKSASDR